MMNRKAIKKIVLLVLPILMGSCGKEGDYRMAWLGDYSYSYHKYTWNPYGSGPDYYGEGTLRVLPVEDSCVKVIFEDSSSWLCRVNENGDLSLRGEQYRAFSGRFHSTDSLYVHCANFSPASGTGWNYYCKKKIKTSLNL